MRVLEGIDALRELEPQSVISVGNFDGMHLGHRKILEMARSLREEGKRICVVTFEPHPLTVLRPTLAPPRLTPPAVKRALLEAAGVDVLVILPPTPAVLNLTAENFWQIIRDEVRPAHMVEGSSFFFGKGRGGTIEKLREWASQSGVKLHVIDGVSVTLLDLHIVQVSSSLIRWLLAYGRVRDAAICLGRPYALRGEVVRGFGRGKDLGVPTANLRCDDQLIPDDGVYAGRCEVNGKKYAAAVSIGTLPTFAERARQVEAHLLDFCGDLYGSSLEVELLDWLREQRKFADVDALRRGIDSDLQETLARVN
jgi:riboflavin kinase / FMN adenylyltransferase